jgi:DNA-binding CsgD family transcriptional regulator
VVDALAELERGRQAYADEAWSSAYDALSAVDHAGSVGPEDLERLATAAYMLGREAEYLGLLERAHRRHLAASHPLPALRCAFWIGVNLAGRGEHGRASGWLGRARRLLEDQGEDRVEGGYLLLPVVFEHEAHGDLESAAATAGEAAAIGRRFGDHDLVALAAHEQGHCLIRGGRIAEGMRLLDETMVAVTVGELSPIVSGIVYCGVILACQDAHEVRRAQEWTAALSGWCERQPDLVAFTGRCITHRAELMQLHGALDDALQEARRAEERCDAGENAAAAGEACYRQGEVHRTLGQLDLAEAAYRRASRRGREPQPGLALLRLAQGDVDAATAAVRRILDETGEPANRARALPAYVEIMLAAGDLDAARAATAELERLAGGHEEGTLEAVAAQARGAVELAEGNAAAALVSLRRAGAAWQRVEAPYEAARVRELVGCACRVLGDDDTAELELEAARSAYTELGARPDAARIRSLRDRASRDADGLTGREREVLRLVAGGQTNRAIAAALTISERTVDRHVSNIFAKLGVSSRAAATAYAYEHGLL